MRLSLEDLAKYPFSLEAQEHVKARGPTVDELSQPEYLEVLERALERIEEALTKSLVSVKLDRLEVELLSYPTAVLLASLSGDRILINRYAEAEAKRAYGLLRSESSEKILWLARTTFNWDILQIGIKVGSRLYEYSINWTDYLKVALGFKSPHWKLVNRSLVSGRVYLQKHELARLMAEALRERLLSRLSAPPSIEPPLIIKDFVEKARSLVKARPLTPRPLEPSLMESSSESAYPPCIRSLLEDALAGKQLPHMARFTLASFLLSIGKSVEEVVDVFRRLPDFDEKKTAYHVRHIAGEIGSKTKYAPPSCETLRTFNLCNPIDPLCQRVKHPLSFLKIKSKSMIKRQ